MGTKVIESINPATLEPVGEVEITPIKQIEQVVENARKYLPEWKDRGIEERANILKDAQQLLLERSEEFARLITLEMGRSINESLVLELSGSIDVMGYYVQKMHKFLDDRKIPLHHLLFKRRRSTLHFEPLGVLGIISPWNWPLLIPIGSIVPALLSGNCVVFKHSEQTPLIAERMRELFLDAGLPEYAFQIIQGGADQGRALVESSVEKIFFTGSTDVGQKIYHQASRSLKKCVLEMGGSDPAIVCEDADLDFTSSGILWGGFSNCGQNCNGIERLYINEKIADRFIEILIMKMKRLRLGNGMDLETDIGPLASKEQVSKMEQIVKKSMKAGAELLIGGKRIYHLKGYYFEPTLLLWNKSIDQPTDQEIFGPIIFITPVADDREAIALANRSEFGLASSVWTQNARRGNWIARQLETGTVMINDVIVSFGMAEAGWTGIKKSGIGWVHGEKGLDEMVNIKYINREPQAGIQKYWWFTYSHDMFYTMKKGCDFLYSRNMREKLSALPLTVKGFSGYLLKNRIRSDKL